MSPLSSIAHYRITAKLGEGGMGAVWRADDTKLNREVAIKVLPDSFATDPDRLARFTREARVLASLNHPNIAAIYGVEERALVLELVEGPTLADLTAQGPIRLNEALGIARQIADALEAAHDKGIIHRDLKPANVKVTPDGVVKVLDFGLAKAADPVVAASSTANSPTLTIGSTQAGVIMGTAGYMAPEQAAGKLVDKRADIWAFGVVLYEMLTGAHLFAGESVAHILAHVLTQEIDLNSIDPAIRPLVRRCLHRDPRRRLRDIGDARLIIEEHLADPKLASTQRAPAASQARRSILPWLVAALAVPVALAAGFLAANRLRKPTPQSAVRFQTSLFDKANFPIFDLSPDGRYLAFSASIAGRRGLWVRALDSLESHALPGTDGANYPIWSPDSGAIAFFAQGKLKKIGISGGAVQVLCDAIEGRGGAWGQDGVLVFAPTSHGTLYRVSASGGAIAPIGTLSPLKAGEYDRYPIFIQGTDRFFYLHFATNPDTAGIYLGSLSGGAPVRILPDLGQAYYVPDAAAGGGWIIFPRDSAVVAQPFDPEHARLTGDPVLVGGPVGLGGNSGRAAFSASANGTLAIRSNGLRKQRLVWTDRAGRILSAVAPAGEIDAFALSPDEKRLLLEIRSGSRADLWLQDLVGGALTRFSFTEHADAQPLWSPDSRSIVYADRPNSLQSRVYRKPADGSSREELIGELTNQTLPADWSRDGKYLLLGNTASLEPRLYLFPLNPSASRPLGPLPETNFKALGGAISPDARWIALVTVEAAETRVSVQAFPGGGPSWQVYSGTADRPAWRRDGRELYFVAGDRNLMAIPVETNGDAFKPGNPQPLFELPAPKWYQTYQPSNDGRRFLVGLPPEGETAVPPLDIILNWPSTMRKSEPAR